MRAEDFLESSGGWAYLIVAIILLLEAVPVVGALIPAQLFLLGAGFLASQGQLGLVRLFLVAAVSLFVADIIAFALGRRYGLALMKRLPAPIAHMATMLSDGLGAHVGKTMVLGKFLGPARALTPPLAGNSGVTWTRFLLWDAVGSVLWCGLSIAAGYLFGSAYGRIERFLGRGAVVLVLVGIVVYIAVTRYRAAKVEEKYEELEAAKHAPPPPGP